MFLFTDPTLLEAVIAAKQRGVKVRVMLNPARRSGETENEEARKALAAAGIEVLDSNPAFDLTHQKSMVIDDETAFVESLNWETRDLTETRDYAVVTTHDHEVDGDDRVLRGRLAPQGLRAARRVAARSGARTTAASASPNSSTRRSTRCGCRTSATRTR